MIIEVMRGSLGTSRELDRMRLLLGGYGAFRGHDDSMSRSGESAGATASWFRYTGLSPSHQVWLMTGGVAALCVGFLSAIFLSTLLPLGLLPILAGGGRVALSRMRFRRAEAFERDYPTFLLSLATSVRTGLDPFTALMKSRTLFDRSTVLARELELLERAVEDGGTEEDAIRGFASSVDHPDIQLFRTAFILARRQGSSLGPCLQRLTRVTRHRQSFRRKARSAVAMQRFSSLGIALCSVSIGIMQILMSPEAVRMAFEHPIGSKLLCGGGAAMVAGLVWMMRLGRQRL